MNWMRQNPFVAGLLAVVVLGAGVFGWLIASNLSRNAEIDEQYTVQVAELQRLQKLQPYPEERSRKLLEGQREQYKAAVTTLQTQLATETSPLLEQNLDPTVFQGRLREAVDRINGSARSNNVALPTDFYLGFDQYKSGLPTPDLTPLLGFQLKQCEAIVLTLIQARVSRIDLFQRLPLPRESNARGAVAEPTPAAPATAGRPPAGGRPGAAAPAAPLVTTYPVELRFRAAPNAFRNVMNELVKASSFHLVRAVRVKNEKDKGPAREENPTTAAAASDSAAATAATPPSPGAGARAPGVPEPALPERQTLRYIVGQEQLDVALRVESVRFASPQEAKP